MGDVYLSSFEQMFRYYPHLLSGNLYHLHKYYNMGDIYLSSFKQMFRYLLNNANDCIRVLIDPLDIERSYCSQKSFNCILAISFLAISTYSRFTSNPINLFPCFRATLAVVPLPINGSKTIPPSKPAPQPQSV